MKPRTTCIVHSLVAGLLAAAVAQASSAGTVGFEETFALAPDRTAVLKQLIPGTEDFYYYTALNQQNLGQLNEVDQTLQAWLKQHGRTTRVVELENRQALLRYETAARVSLDYLTRQLGVQFNHERQTQARQAALPTALDSKLISRDTLTQRALAINPQTLGGFEDSALDVLITSELSDERLHELLTRLTRPDYENLPKLIARDLGTRFNSGFGSLTVHRQLLLTQLDELLKLTPALLTDGNFVNTYMSKLRPAVGVDWRHDPKENQAYLERLWAFVSRLGPEYNSLKANVLYQRLAFDRTQGVWDQERFVAYLQLPRPVFYINPKYVEAAERRNYLSNLEADYAAATMLPPIRADEPLVRSYLRHLLVDAKDYESYLPYIETTYLKELFAEAKLTAGVGEAGGAVGDQEKYFALLPAEKLQALKNRVDLDFVPTNKELFGPADPVGLDVDVKNVKTLIVKVYEINAAGFYKNNKRLINTDINLDGLVANEERTLEYTDSPLRRITRHFDFPQLNARGVYVVELIGNGKSSRALIRKGKLRYLERPDAAGHTFVILDEANKRVENGRLWLAGHEYAADKDGTITVPYSTSPQPQPIVLLAGEFASLDSFAHRAEAYCFAAGIHVPREALLRYGTATVAIRPDLRLNDVLISPKLLEEVTLVITSVDQDNVSTSKEVHDFALFAEKESTHEFAVPDRLRQVSFTLRARVQNVSQGKKEDLTFSKSLALNAIDASPRIEDLHLAHIDGQYVIDVLGKTGEIKADRAVNLVLKHRDYREPVNVTLKSDAQGRVALGALEGITTIGATGPEGGTHVWHPARDLRVGTPVVQGAVGETLKVPYMGTAKEPVHRDFSLLELRDGGTYVTDRLSGVALKDGFLELKDLPAGDYSLLIKEPRQEVTIRIAPGEVREGWVLSSTRYLQLKNRNALQIVSTQAAADKITVQLANAGKSARVHLYATRFVPEYAPVVDLAADGPDVGMRTLPPQTSLYESGRTIGDEYRYILDRKYAAKYPGNMLDRPGLLLNPWAIRSTATSEQEAQEGEQYQGTAGYPTRDAAQNIALGNRLSVGGKTGRGSGSGAFGLGDAHVEFFDGGYRHSQGELTTNLDFLAEPATTLLNLQPNEKGVVTIDRKALGTHQDIHIVAVDAFNTVYREVSLPQPAQQVRDLRMTATLDPAKHFAERKQITVLKKGDKVSLPEVSGSNLEVYDSLAKVCRLYTTLHPDATLAEFSFITSWPSLKDVEKREKYSKYACHELNFFLYHKDKAFFETVVLPYLKNKKDKTFLDHWLVGDDLAAYAKPWAYGQLNTLERILLGQRLAGEAPRMARHIKDRYDLLPPDIEKFNLLFATALKSSALESDPARAGALEAAKPEELRAAFAFGGDRLDGKTGAKHAAASGDLPASSPAAPPLDKATMEKTRQMVAQKIQAKEAVLSQADAVDRKAFDVDKADMPENLLGLSSRRELARKFYRVLDKTMEWAENNYYHLPIAQQNADLVAVNAFWKDYAAAGANQEFLSSHLAEPTANFSEMMLALAVLDLPFDAPAHQTKREAGQYTLTAAGPVVAFHKQIQEALPATEKTPILVSQNYYRAEDRYTFVDNERTDKYVAEEFLTQVVYGCQVVITNPTSSRQKLDALVQLPQGAMPVANAQYNRGLHLDLQPYETRTVEYAFYFPGVGSYAHYPVQVAKNEKLLAAAAPGMLKVVATPSKADTTSWKYLAQNGSADEVIKYLQTANIERLNLEPIAWRMKEAEFYKRGIELLQGRHVYQNTLWSYSLKHDDPANIREFLQHQDGFLSQCGDYLDSRLVTIDPVIRKTYEHLEYAPLVNARAQRLGRDRQIVNNRFYQQYELMLHTLAYHPKLNDVDLLAVTYYQLLQDRVEEGLGYLKQVNAQNLPEQIQYDYLTAYAAFYSNTPAAAGAIAEKYRAYPVERWRNMFANVSSQLDEIAGKAPQGGVASKDDRNQQQNVLASTEPAIELKVEDKKVLLNYKNLAEVRVNYYLMDIELMFSQNPFLQLGGGQFALIKPNESTVVKLDAPPARETQAFDLPEKYLTSNVMVEIVGGGQTKSQAYYANSLRLLVAENYGQLTVSSAKSGKALPTAYVKTYARMKDGRVKFFKDGYTDWRGKFDYTSLNTDELDNVEKFAILIMTDTDGAIIREALPPKR